MIKLTYKGQSTVVEAMGGVPLMEDVTEEEARKFMRDRNAPTATSSGSTSEDPPPSRDPRKGDVVQWTPGGIDQFEKPSEILRVSRGFAFFEGSETGAPLSELTIITEDGE